jgi:hypothetical protein
MSRSDANNSQRSDVVVNGNVRRKCMTREERNAESCDDSSITFDVACV